MRLPDIDSVQRLIDHGIPESQSIEYKSDLSLQSRDQRRELLKDLSAMGNGGGGTVVFGMREENQVAKEITPLSDPGIAGVVQDIVRDGIRPPLVFDYETYPHGKGYVFVVDVETSVLGPYQVDLYGDPCYYRRRRTRAYPMSESEVRDAYALAVRLAERRTSRWRERAFPLRLRVEGPTLSISAIPLEPESDILRLRTIELGALRPPEDIRTYTRQGLLPVMIDGLRLWADGFTGEFTIGEADTGSAMRVHRDGSCGIACHFGTSIEVAELLRAMNGYMAYLGWLWATFGLTRPVDLLVRVDGLQKCQMRRHAASTALTKVVEAAGGLNVDFVELKQEVLPWQLAWARVRHGLLDVFSDRLVQAFGSPRHDELFRRGWLFGQQGVSEGFRLQGGGITRTEARQASIDTEGCVTNPSTGLVVAHVDDGAILDKGGDAIAIVEFSPSSGCPVDFLPKEFTHAETEGLVIGIDESPKQSPKPSPTGAWSEQTLAGILAPRT